jgi:hypothetical protein
MPADGQGSNGMIAWSRIILVIAINTGNLAGWCEKRFAVSRLIL